jgi:hypothetical protein
MDKQTLEAATVNFNLPHDVVGLPSGGIFYKSKKKSVKIGYLTANDENILAGMLQNSKDNMVLNLIRNKMYETDLKPEELLEGDIQAILIFLRNSSFGPEYTLSVTDPKTDKEFETTFILDELTIKKMENTPDENGLFSTTLPRSGDVVKLRLLSYHEDFELNNSFANYPVGRVVPIITTRLIKQIESINENTDKVFISTYVSNMPIMDSKHIRKFINDHQPGLDLKRSVKTPSGEIVETYINFGVDFFRPFF